MSLFASNVKKMFDQVDVAGLVKLLQHHDRQIRHSALEALGRIRAPQVALDLIPLLSGSDPDDRAYAAGALAFIGANYDRRLVQPLLHLLLHGSSTERCSSVRALNAMRPHCGIESIQPLISALQDEDEHVWKHAQDALIRLGAPVTRPLAAALRGADDAFRRRVAAVYAALAAETDLEQIADLLLSDDLDTCFYAGRALKRIGNRRAIELLVFALYPGRDPSEYAIAEIGATAVDTLIHAVQHPSQFLHRVAATLPRPVVLESWRTEYLQGRAAMTLGLIGDLRAIGPLTAALASTDSDLVVPHARQALREIPKPSPRQRTEQQLEVLRVHQSDPMTAHRFAVEDLLKIQSPEVVDSLIPALSDPEPRVRAVAADAIGRIKSPDAVRPLCARLTDPDQWVRYCVIDALGSVGGTEAVQALIGRLRVADWETCVRAVAALGKTRDPAAVEPILRVLSERPAVDSQAALTFIHAFEDLGDPRTVKPLVDMARNLSPNLRILAVNALGTIGGPEALPHLDRTAQQDKDSADYGPFNLLINPSGQSLSVAGAARQAAWEIRRRQVLSHQ